MDLKDFDLEPFGFKQTEDGELQRTEEWLAARSGNFTGSKNKDLMNCGRSTAKMQWGTVEKLVDFGATAEKYVYAVGKERITGHQNQQIKSQQMYHGILNEPLLIQKMLDQGIITEYEPCAFVKFEGHNGGASPDGKVLYNSERMALEVKCCVSWDGHYKRMYNKVDQKHDDFWQCQAEMLALSVSKLLYVVASPMTIEDYDVQVIDASPIHQKAMLQRIEIADTAIGHWGAHHYGDALKLACAEWQE